MATPDHDYIARLADAVARVYRDAELSLIRVVAAEVARDLNPDETRDQALAAARVAAVAERIAARLDEYLAAAAEEGLTAAHAAGVTAAGREITALLGKAAANTTTDAPLAALAAAARALVDQVTPAHRAILRTTRDAYRDAVAETLADRLSGATPRRRDHAQRVLDRLADRGIGEFTDRSGRTWDLATYAEMATRTAAARAMVDGHLERLAAIGHTLVYCSNAPQECILCRPWEGQVLRAGVGKTGRVSERSAVGEGMVVVDVAGTVAEAMAAGLFHPNCRHALSAYLPGATRIPAATADPEGDKARQRHRALERGVRKWKAREAAALDDDTRRYARSKVRAWQTALRKHVDDTGLIRQPNRERLNLGHTIGRTGNERELDDTNRTRQARDEYVDARTAAVDEASTPPPDPEPPAPAPELADPGPDDDDPVDVGGDPAALSDEELEAAMSASVVAGTDEAMERFEVLSAESDARETRRARAERKRETDRARRQRKREERDAAREQAERETWERAERLIDRGMDPQAAEAEVRGVDVEDIKKRDVLLELGWPGGWERATRLAYEEYLQVEYMRAEDATRGAMLNKRGRARRVDPRTLFLGTEAFARANASEELLAYWDETGGRYTLEQYRYELLWGTHEMRRRFGLSGRGDYLQ